MKRLYKKPEISESEAQQKFLNRAQPTRENLYVYAIELRSLAKEAYPTLDSSRRDSLVRMNSLTKLEKIQTNV